MYSICIYLIYVKLFKNVRNSSCYIFDGTFSSPCNKQGLSKKKCISECNNLKVLADSIATCVITEGKQHFNTGKKLLFSEHI